MSALSVAESAYVAEGEEFGLEIFQAYAKLSPEELEANGTLICRPAAGYADRIKGIVTVAAIALLFKRKLVVDWPEPGLLSDVLLPNKMPWSEGPLQDDAAAHRWFSSFAPVLGEIAKTEDVLGYLERDVITRPTVDFVCNQMFLHMLLADPRIAEQFGGMTPPQLFKTLFAFVFKLNPAAGIMEQAEPFLEKIRARKVIGVHIRFGKTALWDDPVWEDGTGLQRFDTALREIAKDPDLEGALVYFASDSMDAKNATSSGELFSGFEIIQQDIEPFNVAYMTPGQEHERIMRDTLVDHICLSACDSVLMGKGNFAFVASALGQNRVRRV